MYLCFDHKQNSQRITCQTGYVDIKLKIHINSQHVCLLKLFELYCYYLYS